MANDPDSAGPDDKSSDPNPKTPIDQLVELLVYAPVGMAYEYGDVLPQLIKRGKSQVQLAKVMGQMAAQQSQAKAKQGTDGVDDAVNEVVLQAASVLAKGITEFGQLIGLAPQPSSDTETSAAQSDKSAVGAEESAAEDAPDDETASEDLSSLPPIAGYDEMTARQIVPMLSELDSEQRALIRSYESQNRARKTVMGKLDQLDA